MQSINNTTFYKKSIKQFGVSAQGVHWNSKYSQYKRFEILTSFIQTSIKDSTIIDAGCGFAEYYSYLYKNSLLPKEYIGIDCEKTMINVSKQRFSDITFYTKNILKDDLPLCDYYICSGAMNILNKEDFFNFILKCYTHSKKGFIFNFLKLDSYNKINSENVLEFCSNLTKNIEMQDNYLENDFSVFLKKESDD